MQRLADRPSTVITAAHCWSASRREAIGCTPGGGSDDRAPLEVAFDRPRGQHVPRASGLRHNPQVGSYDDVGLFQLAAPMNVSGARVRPIGLADAPAAPGALFHVHGFGDKNPKELRTMQTR